MLDKIGINPLNLVAQIVNFGILLFVLTRFIYKPILHLLDERAKKIQKGLEAAEANIREREKFVLVKKEEMAKTRMEMEKLLTKAGKDAKSMADEIIQSARETAKKQAEKEFELASQRLSKKEQEMKDRMAKLAVSLAKTILQKTLNQNYQEKIFSAQLGRIKKLKVN